MNVFIYWNNIDTDSKKIYKFLKQGTFIETLQTNFKVYYHNPMFRGAIPPDSTLYSEISDSDLVLFFTHGTEDAILKAQFKFEEEKKHFSLIDMDNAKLLAGKKVIAICCSSADKLGPYCVQETCSNFYIGFTDPIVYDDGAHITERGLIYTAYSNAFEHSFFYALNSKCTAQEFVTKLKLHIDNMLTSEVMSLDKNHTAGSLSEITYHRQSAKSLVALGSNLEPIFI